MTRYIGLDAHASSCTLAIVGPSGRRLKSLVVETNGSALITALRAIPGPRHLCIEEGTPSAWLYEILSPVVDELVVTQQSRKPLGQKNDKVDAFGLADALRTGRFDKRVYKAPSRFTKLRMLAHTYTQISRDRARTKNRIKSVFRSRGIDVEGKAVYNEMHQGQWLAKLPPSCRSSVKFLYEHLDALSEIKRDAHAELVAESHRHDISHILETCPGLGEVRVAQIIPTVVTPHRFRTARQYWAYCGLSIIMQTSSDWRQGPGGWTRKPVKSARGLNRQCNRTLKAIYKDAATSVLKKPGHPLKRHYERMLEQGTRPPNAKLTLARKIAALSLAMWKNQERYDPERTLEHN